MKTVCVCSVERAVEVPAVDYSGRVSVQGENIASSGKSVETLASSSQAWHSAGVALELSTPGFSLAVLLLTQLYGEL